MKNSYPGRLMPSLLQPKKQRGVHCWQLRRLTLVAQFALPFAFTSEQASVRMWEEWKYYATFILRLRLEKKCTKALLQHRKFCVSALFCHHEWNCTAKLHIDRSSRTVTSTKMEGEPTWPIKSFHDQSYEKEKNLMNGFETGRIPDFRISIERGYCHVKEKVFTVLLNTKYFLLPLEIRG